MTGQTEASYTKLKSGGWGIRINSDSIRKGELVEVVKKNGSKSMETVGAILWSGNGASICSIATGMTNADRNNNDGGRRSKRPCYMCGSHYCEGARGGLCIDD